MTTADLFFRKQVAEQPIDVHIAFAALPGVKIKLEIRISCRCFAYAIDRRCPERRPTQIGVKNDASCVDYRPQGVAERTSQFASDRIVKPGKRQP